MTARFHAITLLVLLLVSPPSSRAADPPRGGNIPKGTVTQHTFKSSTIFPGTVRDYWVYVPKQYDPARPACVHVNQDGIQFNAPAVFDELIAKKEMPVTIGVFIAPGKVKPSGEAAMERFNRSFEYDGLGDAYARFVLDEVLPEVEKMKTADGRPIRLSHEGNDRSIGGSSSGAICSFTAAWERPDAFRRVFSSVGTYVGLRGGNSYATLVRKVEPKPIRLFLQDGSNDLNIFGGDWWMANQELERALRFAGYEVDHAWGTGGHDGKHATQIFPEAMRWLWKDWPTPVKPGNGSSHLQEVLLPGELWRRVPGSFKANGGLAANAEGAVFFGDAAAGKIYKASGLGEPTLFVAGSEIGGLAFGPDGSLVAFADESGHLVIYDAAGKLKSSTLVEGLHGRHLVVRHDGQIYAISRGAAANEPTKLWHFSPAGQRGRVPIFATQLVDSDLHGASGICLSADQAWLFVAEGGSHWGYSYKIEPDGSLSNKQHYHYLHVPDTAEDSGAGGMCLDRDGRLYVASRMGIQVCDQLGRVTCILTVPGGTATDVCFAGAKFDTLYASGGGQLFARKLRTHGANAFQPPVKPPSPRL